MQHIVNNGFSGRDLWIGKAAPRYTSYPAATAFQDGVGETDYTAALAAVPADAAVSLYIHIPFCQALCLYCGCNTAVTGRVDRLQSYTDALKGEAAMIRGIMGRRRISHVHFGGGTPNILPPRMLHDLFDDLHDCFDFGAAQEIAMELDPRTVTDEGLDALAACGITRVSLGVQDFDPAVQAAIRRVQPYHLVADVCDKLRRRRIDRINFDLIYGLPRQTPQTVAETAAQSCRLSADRVALFSYAHVPQMKTHQRALESYGLPDLMQKLDMEQAARDVFVGQGYAEIGMDHFAVADDSLAVACRQRGLRRNFQGYTDDAADILIGLGASSISQTEQGYFQNIREESGYLAAMNQGQLAVCRGHLLTAEDRLRRAVIEQFMCFMTCDLASAARRFGFDVAIFAEALRTLAPYQAAGLVQIDAGVVTVSAAQKMAVRAVCLAFDDYTGRQTIASRVA